MKSNTNISENIDEYIVKFPSAVQKILKKLRQTIKKAAPKAEEKVSYQMPAFVLNGMLVYFAGYKNHIGLYPGAAAIVKFQKKLTKYHTSKGTVQFQLNEPLPFELVAEIVKYRVKVNLIKAVKIKSKK